jgi:outer membrane lipoprotein-sorting protein
LRSRAQTLLASIVAFSILTGCPARLVPMPADALTKAADVLALAQARSGAVRSISAEARLSSYGDQGARKGRVIIVARRPASLHFQALAPTDQMLGVLASNGETFTSFESGAKVCYVGSSCPRNVSRMVPLHMEGKDVVELLAGGAPLMPYDDVALTWDEEIGSHKLVFTAIGSVQEVWVAHGTGDVLATRAVLDGEEHIRTTFEDFHAHGDVRIPHVLTAKLASGSVDLRIVYRDVEVNGEVSDDAFVIPCPKGMAQERLLCPGERAGAESQGGSP